MFALVQKHWFRNVLWSKLYCFGVVFILEKDSRESKSIEINQKMKILTVVFMLLFKFSFDWALSHLCDKHVWFKHTSSLFPKNMDPARQKCDMSSWLCFANEDQEDIAKMWPKPYLKSLFVLWYIEVLSRPRGTVHIMRTKTLINIEWTATLMLLNQSA